MMTFILANWKTSLAGAAALMILLCDWLGVPIPAKDQLLAAILAAIGFAGQIEQHRLVGVLVEVGRGQLDPDSVAALLFEASPLPARLTAPASGLFLERVFYRGEARGHPLLPVFNLTPS